LINYQSFDAVTAQILGRSTSLFEADMFSFHQKISEVYGGARVLVIGAAGSVGGSVSKELVAYNPRCLHLVDLNENGIVEVVRDIRSSLNSVPKDFSTFAIDIRQPEFSHLLNNQKPYDIVLNFSALKHVRSEKDPYTLARMIDTNVISIHKILEKLTQASTKRFFSVSSDKAVQPHNLMGASKAAMEQVMWSYKNQIHVSSARFANVAFSSGSLLEGFLYRLAKTQPIAAPSDIDRYFISHQEAGHLCLLGSAAIENTHIIVPKMEPGKDAISFIKIAEVFLNYHGYDVFNCSSENEAKEMANKIQRDGSANNASWPCYFSTSDTSGEKKLEEYWHTDEAVDEQLFQFARVIKTNPVSTPDVIRNQISKLERAQINGKLSIGVTHDIIQDIVPSLIHVDVGKNLDQKM